MAKIPFDIKYRPQIESGEYKVETWDGQSVSILAFDIHFRGMSHMILAKYNECYDYWPFNGRYNRTSPDCNLDLFLVTPELELSEFEKAVGAEIFDSPFNAEQIKVIKEESAKLLKLAREGYVPREEKWSEVEKTAKAEFIRGTDFGRVEVLKDLPKWKKVNEGDLLEKSSKYLLCSDGRYFYCCGSTITRDGYMLLVDDLGKLPKEE